MSVKHPSERVLNAYSTDKLDSDKATKVAKHLKSCQRCQNQLSDLEGRDSDEDSDLGLSALNEDSVTYANVPTGGQDSEEGWAETVIASAGIAELPPDYEMLGELGRGGVGVVLKARRISADRFVALKLLQPAGLADAQARERLQREANTITKLKHPGIVRVFDVVVHQGALFLELELVEGGVLSNYILQPLDARWAAAMMLQIAQAVSYFHTQSVLHRDLKPDNVLISNQSKDNFVWSPPAKLKDVKPVSVPQAKITDFGLAKRLNDDASFTRADQMLGTPLYMAPEQTEKGGSDRFTTKVDIHALGSLLYEMLTAHSPFKGKNVAQTLANVRTEMPVSPSSLVETVPTVLSDICLRCLMKNPDERYATAKDLADDLELFLQGKSIKPKHTSFISRMIKKLGGQDD